MASEENNNSASRSRWALLNALHEHDSIPTIEAWANVLISDHEKNFDHYEVLKLLDSLRQELSLVKVQLAKKNVPERLYVQYIDKLVKSTEINNISAPWSNFKQHITMESLLCLSFAAHLIGEDEFKFEDGDIEEIEKLIGELNDSVNESYIDPLLKHFIQSQIDILTRSVKEYHIKGGKAFKGTYIEGLGKIVENEDVIKSNSDSPPVVKLKQVWDKFRSATEKVAVANKSIETWGKLLEKGSEVLDQLSKLS